MSHSSVAPARNPKREGASTVMLASSTKHTREGEEEQGNPEGNQEKERAREEIQRRTRSAHEDYKRHRFLKKPLSRTQRQTCCTDWHILQVPRSHAKHLCTPTAATQSYSSSK